MHSLNTIRRINAEAVRKAQEAAAATTATYAPCGERVEPDKEHPRDCSYCGIAQDHGHGYTQR